MWIVGHQNEIATGQRNQRGQGCPFVAAFFLFDLNHDFLAFGKRVLDRGVFDVHSIFEKRTCHFLER